MGNISSLTPDAYVDATLYYFRGRGKADQIRWLLAAAGISFCQRDIDTEGKFQFLQKELPFGKVPMLQIDGMEIVESQAILRYVAKRADLMGESDAEAVLCDQVAEAVRDALNVLLTAPFERMKMADASGDESAQHHIEKMQGVFAKFAVRLEKVLEHNGGEFIVGSRLTYADVLVAHCITWYVEECGPDVMEPYPKLISLQNKVVQLPEVMRFIRSTLFQPLGDVAYANEVLNILGVRTAVGR